MTDKKNLEIEIRLTAKLAKCAQINKLLYQNLEGVSDIKTLFQVLDKRYPGLQSVLYDVDYNLLDGINIYLNGDNIRYLDGLSTMLKEGDTISIIPAEAAG
jgi:sulfur-carrier protein